MNIIVLAVLIGGLVFLAGIGGLFIAIGLCMIIIAGVFWEMLPSIVVQIDNNIFSFSTK